MKTINFRYIFISILTLIAAAFITACGNSSNVSTAASQTLPGITKVEARVQGSKILSVKFYTIDKTKPAYTAVFVQENPSYKFAGIPKVVTYNSWSEYKAARGALDPKYKTALKTAATTSPYNPSPTLVGVGYAPSTNQVISGSTMSSDPNSTSACYLSATGISASSNNIGVVSDLTSTNSTQSFANVMTDTASVAGSYGIFSASANAAYSNAFQGSTSSGSFGLAAAVGAVVNTGVSAINNLTSYGAQLLNQSNTSSFNTTCGPSALTAYIGGILVTQAINVTASSQSASQSFEANLTGSATTPAGSAQVTEAYTSASNNSGSISSSSISYSSYGDIQFTAADNNGSMFTDAMAAAVSANSASYGQCANGVMSACATYNSAIGSAVTANLSSAESAIQSGQYVGGLYVFPNGINISGFKNPTVSGNPINPSAPLSALANTSSTSAFDPYASSITFLQNAVSLIYQLNTLSARVGLLSALPGYVTSNENSSLTALQKAYVTDSNAIQTALTSCYGDLASSSSASSLLPSSCSANVSLANGAINTTFNALPASVYYLYQNQPQGSLGSLLNNNTVALQYNVNYNETFAGTNASFSVGNQINFGLAYYNHSNKNAYLSSNSDGYIMPLMSNPTLLGLGTYQASNGTQFPGVQWWTDAFFPTVTQNLTYPTNPLYFTFNNANNTTGSTISFLTMGQQYSSGSSSGALYFNKMYGTMGDDAYSTDSSGYNPSLGSLTYTVQGATYTIPTPTPTTTSKGYSLQQIVLAFTSGLIPPSNASCYPGVQTAGITWLLPTSSSGGNSPGPSYISGVYGSGGQLCGNSPANPSANFNGTVVQNMSSSITFVLNPIASFFGF